MALESRSTLWVDAVAGQTVTRINTQGGAAIILPSLVACLNSDVAQFWEGTLATNVPSPTSADYISVTQRATLVFSTAGSAVISLTLPAPKLSIFLADGRTMDLTNVDVAALITACIGVLANEAGATATAAIVGFL